MKKKLLIYIILLQFKELIDKENATFNIHLNYVQTTQ